MTDEKRTNSRTYVVLTRNGDGWKELGTAEAANDRRAMEAVLEKDAVGVFVAVPERSWRPAERLVDTTPRVRWS